LSLAKKDVPNQNLIFSIDDTIYILEKSIKKLIEKELQNEYPVSKFEYNESTGFLLIHLLDHLNYRIGQINYHRRLLDN